MSIIAPAQDAFGQALLDQLNERPLNPLMLEVDDGFSVPAMSPAWFFLPPTQWSDWEREALEHVTGPILDLGTGGGRAALALQQRGLEVTAVDSSPGAVAACQQQGIEDVRLLDFLDDLPDDKRWASVLMLCGNFGLAGGWDETRDLLKLLHMRCAKDAIIIADTVDPTVNADEHSRTYQQEVLQAGRYIGDITLRLTYGELASPWWKLTNFVIKDIPRLLEGTGWALEKHHVPGLDHYLQLRRIQP